MPDSPEMPEPNGPASMPDGLRVRVERHHRSVGQELVIILKDAARGDGERQAAQIENDIRDRLGHDRAGTWRRRRSDALRSRCRARG